MKLCRRDDGIKRGEAAKDAAYSAFSRVHAQKSAAKTQGTERNRVPFLPLPHLFRCCTCLRNSCLSLERKIASAEQPCYTRAQRVWTGSTLDSHTLA